MNRKEVTVGFIWNFAFGLPNKLLFPILTIIIARVLGPREMGVFAVLTTVLSISDVIRDAGLGHCYIADRDADDPEREAAYHSLAVLSAAILAAVVFLGRDQIGAFFGLPQISWGLIIVSAALFANGFTTIPLAKLNRLARFRDAGIVQTVSALVSYGVAVPLAFLGFGFRALVWWLLVRSILNLAFALFAAPVRLGTVRLAFLGSVVRRSSSILTQNLMYSIYTILDNALVTKLFGPVAIGFYSTAWGLAIKPVEFVSFPLGNTLFVAYTKRSHDLERFASLFARSVAAAAMLTLPMFVYLGLFARELVLVLYGNAFEGAVPLLRMLVVYFAFRSLGTLAGSALVAGQRAYLSVISWLVGFSVAITGILINYGPPLGPVRWPSAWGSLSLGVTVFWITAGACCAYAATLISALAVLRPKKEDLRKIGAAVLAASVPAAVVIAMRLVPAGRVQLIVLSLFAVAIAQLAVIGVLVSGSWRTAFSPGGFRRIWGSL